MVGTPSIVGETLENQPTHDYRNGERPVRVLHIVENLHIQAVENWLLRTLRVAAREYPLCQWTFFCTLGEPGRLDEEIRQLGATVIHSRYSLSQNLPFLSSLRRVMKRGRYDILHCHHDVMSAVYLLASLNLPFRKRIVHVHNTALGLLTPSRWKTALLREPMRQMCIHLADQVVGISSDALNAMIANKNPRPGRDLIVHYGVDTSRFTPWPHEPESFRRSLGIAPDARLVLFVGRMDPYKNPLFVVEMMEHIARAMPGVVAVLVGTGVLEQRVMEFVKERRLEKNVKTVGWRDDVAQLMQLADLLVWPSQEQPKEGLGLGIVEAQAAGLPVLMSRSVPPDAVIIPELVNILPLTLGAAEWAKAALDIFNRPKPSKSRSLSLVEASSFSLKRGVSNLMSLYTSTTY